MNNTSINKMRNAQKRFRQGRITYKKLQELYTKYAKDIVSEVNVAPVEHVHGEHCNHDAPQEDALNDPWFTQDPATDDHSV